MKLVILLFLSGTGMWLTAFGAWYHFPPVFIIPGLITILACIGAVAELEYELEDHD